MCKGFIFKSDTDSEVIVNLIDYYYDRQEIDIEVAIKMAIGKLSDDDLLVITGKGHEQNQIVKDQIFKFDDIEEIKQIVGYSM